MGMVADVPKPCAGFFCDLFGERSPITGVHEGKQIMPFFVICPCYCTFSKFPRGFDVLYLNMFGITFRLSNLAGNIRIGFFGFYGGDRH